MGRLQRIVNFLISLVMIWCGVDLLLDQEGSLEVVAIILGIAVVVYGVRKLWYYLTMARHMAGGISVLFIAVIALDLGSFALLFSGDPKIVIVLYLVCYNMYAGVLAIARGVESRMFNSPWKMSVFHGIVHIVLAILCLVFVGSDQILIIVFCVGLFYAAGVRLISVFKPTEIIYIQ